MGPISGMGKDVDAAYAAMFEAKYKKEQLLLKRIDLLEKKVKRLIEIIELNTGIKV